MTSHKFSDFLTPICDTLMLLNLKYLCHKKSHPQLPPLSVTSFMNVPLVGQKSLGELNWESTAANKCLSGHFYYLHDLRKIIVSRTILSDTHW